MILKSKQHGVDWLTLTAVQGGARDNLRQAGHLLLEREHRLGNAKSERGYHGISGAECGPVFIGDSEATTMLILRGGVASAEWPKLASNDYRATRIDIQCTVQLPEYDGELAHRLQDASLARRQEVGSKVLPKLRYAGTVEGGETRYWGAPSSDRIMRIYDKDKQSGDEWYRNCWRFEVQYRRHIARALWMRMCAGQFNQFNIHQVVQGQMEAYCIPAQLDLGEGSYIAGPPRNVTTAERRLKWIRNQVFPTMQKLDQAGYGDVVRALVFAIDE